MFKRSHFIKVIVLIFALIMLTHIIESSLDKRIHNVAVEFNYA
jgi:hypothetical protein